MNANRNPPQIGMFRIRFVQYAKVRSRESTVKKNRGERLDAIELIVNKA